MTSTPPSPETPPTDDRRQEPRARARTAGAVALLLLLPLALLWPSLLGREVFLPFSVATYPPFAVELAAAEMKDLTTAVNMDVTEIPITFIPELQHVHQELAAGRLPHWNPYARFGAALLATSVVGLMYPPNWLAFLALAPAYGLGLNAYLALAIAGVLMFGCLRALGLSRLAAVFGAVAFAWSGTLAANLHFYQRIHALVWLPGMVWALVRMQRSEGRTRRRAGAGLALCLAMSWLAGFPAYAAAATFVAAGSAGWLVLAQARTRGLAAGRRLAFACAVCAGLGLALAAVQLLPMFAFFPESNRDPNPTRDSIAAQAFAPMGFLGYALPDVFGTPARGPRPPSDYSLLAWSLFDRRSWDSGVVFPPNFNYTEYTVYPGALTLLLAIGGLLARGHAWRLFALVLLVALWVLGCASAHSAWLNDLPLVRSVPPMRFLGPACALVAALAALGIEHRSLSRGRALAVALAAAALAIAAGIARTVLATFTPETWLAQQTPLLLERYTPRFPNATPELVQALLGPYADGSYRVLRDNLTYGAGAFALGAVLFALWAWLGDRRGAVRTLRVAALLATAAELFLLAQPLNRGRPDVPLRSPALDFLRAERDARARQGGFAVIRGAATAGEQPEALPPCLLVPERIRDLHAYTFVDARSHKLFAALYGPDHLIRGYWPKAFPDDERLARPLFDLLGVRYLLAAVPMRFAGKEVFADRRPRGAFFIYEREQVLPRAFVVPALREVADEAAVVTAMISPDLEPRRAVLATPEQAAALRPHAGAEGAEARAVDVVADTPSELTLDVAAGSPGFLVVSDALMRGWRATVAGSDVPIARGNLFMRVLPLGPEATRVRMHYEPPRLLAGASVSAAALLALAWLALAPARRRRPAPPPASGTAASSV